MLNEISLAASELAHIGTEKNFPTIIQLAKYKECSWNVVKALENLILNGCVLSGVKIKKYIEPIINKHKKEYMSNPRNGAGILQKCIRILLFSDEPILGIELLNSLSQEVQWHYEIRDTIEAMGYCDSEEVLDFLITQEHNSELLKFSCREWISALSNYSNPKVRSIFSNLINRFINEENIEGCNTNVIQYVLEYTVTNLVKVDNEFWTEIETRCINSKSDEERVFLASVLEKLETVEALYAACHLVRDDSNIPIPNYVFKILEDQVTNKIYTGSNTYYSESKESNEIRKFLFNLAMHDPIRKKSALSLLIYIEKLRIETGRSPDEFRHPRIDMLSELNNPWPMIFN